MNIRILYNTMVLFLLIACEKKVDNFLPDGNINDGIHDLKVYEELKGDPSKMNVYTRDGYPPYRLLDTLKKYDIQYFTDSVTCNRFIKIEDTSFTMTGFDFENYVLVPMFISSAYSVTSYNIYPLYQVKCILNTVSKTATIIVRSKYVINKDRNSSTSGVYLNYIKWLSVPKLPNGYQLIVPKYVDSYDY
ncbi:MAG: hypothetical protein Q8K70_08640 [Bacteroidota bacterium]|nr:hypothetical protein [Bacteroidota bacterium]